ncbi:hypothetical protein CDIK_2224 [Cucumispora dikerogammari]|nr:hypothetical protein CDIK_2224 [Cucumispora dikerogammari]
MSFFLYSLNLLKHIQIKTCYGTTSEAYDYLGKYTGFETKYPDFTHSETGKSTIFGFLLVNDSSACFVPKSPDQVSLYLDALIKSPNVDYHALNWFINNALNYLTIVNNQMKKNTGIKTIGLTKFTYFTPNDLKTIASSLIGIDPKIFEQFKPENSQSASASTNNYSYKTELEKTECKASLHDVYIKYLSKLVDQVTAFGGVVVPSDYVVHSVLFTGDSVKGVGNVGIEMKVTPEPVPPVKAGDGSGGDGSGGDGSGGDGSGGDGSGGDGSGGDGSGGDGSGGGNNP